MSDGPYKSLPLGASWKRVAEKVANGSFSTDELLEELVDALRKEFPKASLVALIAVLDPPGQKRLFLDDQTAALDAISRAHPGCSATIALVECATEACSRQMTPEKALSFAVAAAAREIFDARERSIEEHYHRKEGAKAGTFMRERCEAMRTACDFDQAAAQLLTTAVERGPKSRSKRRTGLEDGPALSP